MHYDVNQPHQPKSKRRIQWLKFIAIFATIMIAWYAVLFLNNPSERLGFNLGMAIFILLTVGLIQSIFSLIRKAKQMIQRKKTEEN